MKFSEWQDVLEMVEVFFGAEFFHPTNEQAVAWFALLNEYNVPIIKRATGNFLKTKTFWSGRENLVALILNELPEASRELRSEEMMNAPLLRDGDYSEETQEEKEERRQAFADLQEKMTSYFKKGDR